MLGIESVFNFLASWTIHPCVQEIKFSVLSDQRRIVDLDLDSDDEFADNFNNGCLAFLDKYSQNQLSLPALAPVTMCLSSLRIEVEAFDWLASLTSVRCLTLDNVVLIKTHWRHAYRDSSLARVTNLKLINISEEMGRGIPTILQVFGQSLEILRIHSVEGWSEQDSKWGSMPTNAWLFGIWGLSPDVLVPCPKLIEVELIPVSVLPVVRTGDLIPREVIYDKWLLRLQPLPSLEELRVEDGRIVRRWCRSYSTITTLGNTEGLVWKLKESKILTWFNIWSFFWGDE